jgi:DNA polymerase III subunit gamma/tau
MAENFIVSARKYRPSTFKSVVGQDHITQTLTHSIIGNRIAHAYLFTGPRGIGKTTCARIFAKAINCENAGIDGEPCNQCPSCNIFNEQRSMNIFELDAASNNSVDDIRLLVDQVRYAPQAGKYKVYIIDEVHMLSANAFNAFLKTLEEPPSYAIFILATTEKNKIIPTILSRCQIFDFNRIQIRDIVEYLKYIAGEEKIEYEEEALHIIAQKADGALRDALTIFDRIVSFTSNKVSYSYVIENLNIIDYDYFFKFASFILQKNVPECLLLLNKIINLGFEPLNFVNGLAEHYRNLLVCKSMATLELLDIPESLKSRYIDQSKNSSMALILSSLNILNQFSLTFKETKNQRLHTELALLKLCHLGDAINLGLHLKDGIEKKNSLPEIKPFVTAEKKPIISKVEEPAPESKGLNLGNFKQQVRKDEEDKLANSKLLEDQKTEEIVKTDPAVFKTALNEYCEKFLKAKKNSLYTSLTKAEMIFIADDTVQITVENGALSDMLNKEKNDLAIFLNDKYKIYNLKIECKVEHPSLEEQRKYLVNPKDKFNAMREINPDLDEFQQKLGLELEL